jgi:hypothetical protein
VRKLAVSLNVQDQDIIIEHIQPSGRGNRFDYHILCTTIYNLFLELCNLRYKIYRYTARKSEKMTLLTISET